MHCQKLQCNVFNHWNFYPVVTKLHGVDLCTYSNNRFLIHNYVKSLFDVTGIQKSTHLQLHQLTDKDSKHLESLKALGEPTQHSDTLVIYILNNTFDKATARKWENVKSYLSSSLIENVV